MASTNPVVVVHGIQGSWLKDEYPVDYQDSILWTGILRKNFGALHLHELDATVDAVPTRLVHPHQAVPLIYESLVDEIREELEDDHPYVYVFTYDWRKDNRVAAAELGRFVERVLHIASVHERKKAARAPKKVNLIGHSMGGLVIKWYVTRVLNAQQAGRMIDKVITIATPYRGSLKAVEALLPGARNLFGVENQKSMRHSARTMPGIYQLLPSWPEAVVSSETGRNLPIFKSENWQTSLVKALRKRFDKTFFPRMLADAKAFTTAVSQPWSEALRRRIFVVCGVETDTWWQVPVETTKGNRFRFDDARYERPRIAGDKRAVGGDGTLHNVSSERPELPGKAPGKHCLWDKKRRIRDILGGHHANMPNHGRVQDWILSLLELNVHGDAAFESPI